MIWLDFETRSCCDLETRGLDNYAKDPSTEVLLCAYAFDDYAVKLWQPHLNPKIPDELRESLESPFEIVWAWNAAFEHAIINHVLKIPKSIEEFRDPMANSRYLSLPGSLEAAGEILGLKETAKMTEGSRLIKLFCEPEDEGGEETLWGLSLPTFRDWTTDPRDWALFGSYCRQDVIAERAAMKKMKKFALPEHEWDTWFLSERINQRGIPTDSALIAGARSIVNKEIEKLLAQLRETTGLENPGSVTQLLPWLQDRGYTFSSLGKAFVSRAMGGECTLTEEARVVLEIRGQTAKSSVKKYTAIADTTSEDGWLRYAYQYMGAARTGRFSSLGANLANLVKASKDVEKKMDRAVELVQLMDYDAIVSEFGKPLDVVASTTRSSFRAPEGQKFVVADSGSIENRVLGWVSRCTKILDVFKKIFTYEGPDHPEKEIFNGDQFPWDPYLDFATRLYNQSYAELWYEWKILGDATKRNSAKPATLGAGFQLGAGKEDIDKDGNKIWTGLLGYGRNLGVEMTPEDAVFSIKIFRSEYTEVVWYWKDIHRAAIRAVRNPGQIVGVGVPYTDRDRDYYEKIGHPLDWEPRVSFLCHGKKVLEMILPSGRSLHYINPEIREEDAIWEGREYKRETVYYQGKEQGGQTWSDCVASPGRFTENSVQAIARDLLVHGMKLADKMGFPIVLHTYDEIGAVVPVTSPLGLPQLISCLKVSPPYAPDLPLDASGYESPYYKK